MPIFMDRHDLPEEITAENLAELHQKDLRVEHKYGCEGFTYWLDLEKNYAFCLIKAPNKEAVCNMHDEAHGALPNTIIEVDPNIVDSFLGRISDPEKAKDTKLNIINDPAFRIIMVINITQKATNNRISKTIKHYSGRIVKHNSTFYLVSFKTVSHAISAAEKIQLDANLNQVKIGMAAGVPIDKNKTTIFEETILLATRLSTIIKHKTVITQEIHSLYESENSNKTLNTNTICSLSNSDIKFLTELMNYIEMKWQDSNLHVNNLCKSLGYSKSQLYRKLIQLTDKSPNTFIRDYRLNEARKLLEKKHGNISDIAFECGFNSLAYFSKVFKNKYNLLPSKYISQQK